MPKKRFSAEQSDLGGVRSPWRKARIHDIARASASTKA